MHSRTPILATMALVVATCTGVPRVEAAPRAVGVSPYVGARTLDQALDDYRWDIGPARLIGAEAWIAFARFEAAFAVERSSTEQSTGLPGPNSSPQVDLTQVALRLRARLVSWGPVHLLAGAGAGRLHLGWDPERATYVVSGLPDPLTVEYEPIDTWRTELELGARIALPGPVDLGLATTWAHFDLETAHRSGTEIVERDETFSTLDARVFLSWSLWGER